MVKSMQGAVSAASARVRPRQFQRWPGAASRLPALLLLCFFLWAAAARAQVEPEPSAPPAAAAPQAGDSLGPVLAIDAVVISAERPVPTGDVGVFQLPERVIRDRDVASLDELGAALPSTRVSVNSRGEALFMLRAAPERHLRVLLGEIPLTVPWDERADLSMIPTDAVGSLEVRRGVHSALDGTNALAGVVRLLPRARSRPGATTRLGFLAGESERFEVQVLHDRQVENWRLLMALSRRQQEGFLLPAAYRAEYNQGAERLRNNSDFHQNSALLHLDWLPAGVALSLQATQGAKGVPPEDHVPDARFWRYPVNQRALLGLALKRPPEPGESWGVLASFTADWFRQEIRAYDGPDYRGPPLSAGADYERNRDRSASGRCQSIWRLGQGAQLILQVDGRFTRHREVLEIGGPELVYSQLLAAARLEGEATLGRSWRLRLGWGLEGSATPQTGDKAQRGGNRAPVWLLRVDRDVSDRMRFYGSLSSRSRFPSLRELFSGALGKFVPNPGLVPERQDLIEVGAQIQADRWRLELAAFLSGLDGGIEKVALPAGGGLFQRVNVDALIVPGAEFLLSFAPWRGVAIDLQHSRLAARRLMDRGGTAPVEDRPDHISSLALTWAHSSGIRLRLEGEATGTRFSADVTNSDSGLRLLPAQSRWNLRLAYLLQSPGGWPLGWELFLRVNNVFDSQLLSQTGLPDAGRMLRAGLNLDIEH